MNEQLTPIEFHEVEEIFHGALRHNSSGRLGFVQKRCKGRPKLFRAVDNLLAAHETATIHLLEPAVTLVAEETRKLPERIGPFRILKSIGEGGMSEVFLAEQEEPVKRKVALKLMRVWGNTREMMARFSAERQAMALMEHPSIAKIFDAGLTEHGQPYCAMEFVNGQHITEFCHSRRLRLPKRLELFCQVCDAIHHAHERDIVHRDVKPSNILVSMDERRAYVKIIDFGIAKATGGSIGEATIATRTGEIVGTPAYISPEQADPRLGVVDRRTDVYALGIVLYELITGHLPHPPELYHVQSFIQLQRTICELDVPKPSTRFESDSERLPVQAARCRTKPAALLRAVRNDLDWITLKALHKETDHRYPTALALAEDVRRHLEFQPVVAGPPSTTYRLGKFLKRNRMPLLFLVGLVLALGISAYVWRHFSSATHFAKQQAQEATKISKVKDEMLQAASADRESMQSQMAMSNLSKEELEDQLVKCKTAETKLDGLLRAKETQLVRKRSLVSERDTRIRELEKRNTVWQKDSSVKTNENKKLAAKNRWNAYRAAISAAHIAINDLDLDAALEYLKQAPTEERSWEWDYLNAAANPALERLAGYDEEVQALAYGPQGDFLITGGHKGLVMKWTRRSANTSAVERKLLEKDGHFVGAIAVHPKGRHIAIALQKHQGPSSIWIVDSKTSTPLQELPVTGWDHALQSLVYSRDGKTLSWSAWHNLHGIHRWKVSKSNSYQEINRLAAGGHAGTIVLVNNRIFSGDGARVYAPSKPTDSRFTLPNGVHARSIAYDPNYSKLAAGMDGAAGDGLVYVWQLNDEQRAPTILRGPYREQINGVAFSPDGTTLAAISREGRLMIWDPETRTLLKEFPRVSHNLRALAFHPKGDRIATAGGNRWGDSLHIWDANSRDSQTILANPELGHDPIRTIDFTDDGTLLAAGHFSGTVRVWDSMTGELIRSRQCHRKGKKMTSVDFSPDGKWLATAGHDGVVTVRNVVTLAQKFRPTFDPPDVNVVRFSPNGGTLAIGIGKEHEDTGAVHLMDITNGDVKEPFAHKYHVASLDWSDDGGQLALGGREGVRLVNIQTRAVGELLRTGHMVTTLAFNSDGTRLACGLSGGGEVQIWSVGGNNVKCATLARHNNWRIHDVMWTSDDKRVISCDQTASIHVWDPVTADELLLLRGDGDIEVLDLAFDSIHNRLASSSWVGSIRLWQGKAP